MSISTTTINSPLLPDTASTTATWRCVPCDAKGYSVEARISHLSGKKHRKTMATTGSQTKMSTSPQTTADGPIISLDAPMWLCVPCRTKGMNAAAKDTHIVGKKHRKIIGAASDQTGIIAMPSGNALLSLTAANDDDASRGMWTCSICDGLKMAIDSKEAHLQGKKHQKNNNKNANVSERRDAPTAHPIIGALSGSPSSRLRLTTPPIASSSASDWGWVCRICNKTMSASNKQSHLSGQPHARMLAKSSSGPADDPSDPDDSSSDEDNLRQTRNRSSSPEYDSDDVAGLLYDIDTQWGMIPGGGAYKESNHYYGPGIYDYY